MPKKPKKEKPAKRLKPERDRSAYKDEHGVSLTSSSRRPLTILPSDFLRAMQQPAGTPTEATSKMDPPMPTTVIPELNAMPLTPFAYQTVGEAIYAADQVQIKKLNPTGGPNLRFRIELTAAFLADVMEHAYESVGATGGGMDPQEFVHLAVNLVIRRAEEIYASGGA